MKQEKTRGLRNQFTRSLIKDTFLSLEKEVSFEKMSVKRLCEKGGLSRATFYQHYDSLTDVLDEILDEALLFSEQESGTLFTMIDMMKTNHHDSSNLSDSMLPACQRIADSEKYHALFMDDSLNNYIITRIYQHERNTIVSELVTRMGISEDLADLMFQYMLGGSFFVNRTLEWDKNDLWYRFQHMVCDFLYAGMDGLKK